MQCHGLKNRDGVDFPPVSRFFYAAVLATLGGLGWATSSSGKFALAMLINLVIVVQQVVQNAPCYTLSSEIASLRLRGKTQSLAFVVNNVVNLVFVFVVPYIFQNPGNLGAKTALIFAGLTFIGCIWGFWAVPETKGRSEFKSVVGDTGTSD